MAIILGIDVGGTGIKAALVDTSFGQATGLPFVVLNDADAAGIIGAATAAVRRDQK